MLHPEGQFDAEVLEHTINESKQGNERVVVRFKTEHSTIIGWFYLTNRAAEHTVKKLRAMGFTGDDLFVLYAESEAMVGNRCSISVEHSEYEGKTSAKVVFVNPTGGGGGPLMEGNKETALKAKRFNALLKREPKSTPEPATAMSGESTAPLPDDIPPDDIPF